MTPLFACIPVCLSFIALGVVGLFVVLIMGTNHEGPNAPVDAIPSADTEADPNPGRPPLWVVALIFVVVLLHFALLLWVWPEL